MRQLSLLYTANQQCYSVKYCPADSSLIACVSCDKFGVSGAASLYLARYQESAFLESKFFILESLRSKPTLFDVDWSPVDPTLLLTASGDGYVSIWKWPLVNNLERKPIHSQRQHGKEVYTVQWEPSGMSKNLTQA
jgi:WD40 repeat protein